MAPSSTPPVRHLVNELAHTKAPRPSFMHWPPPFLLLYNFSADACTIYTVYNKLKTGRSDIETQLNVTKNNCDFLHQLCINNLNSVALSLSLFLFLLRFNCLSL